MPNTEDLRNGYLRIARKTVIASELADPESRRFAFAPEETGLGRTGQGRGWAATRDPVLSTEADSRYETNDQRSFRSVQETKS
jgi:hypothetical protein